MPVTRPSKVPQDEISREMRTFLDDVSRSIKTSNYAGTAAPAVTDDETKGWQVGSVWFDTTNDEIYACVDATEGAAVWKQLS